MISENILLGENEDRYFISDKENIYLFENNKKLTVSIKDKEQEYSWQINNKGSLIVKSSNETFFLKFKDCDDEFLFLDKYEKLDSEYIKVEELRLKICIFKGSLGNKEEFKRSFKEELKLLEKKDIAIISSVFLILISLVYFVLSLLMFIKDLHPIIRVLFSVFICVNIKEYIIFLYLKLKKGFNK